MDVYGLVGARATAGKGRRLAARCYAVLCCAVLCGAVRCGAAGGARGDESGVRDRCGGGQYVPKEEWGEMARRKRMGRLDWAREGARAQRAAGCGLRWIQLHTWIDGRMDRCVDGCADVFMDVFMARAGWGGPGARQDMTVVVVSVLVLAWRGVACQCQRQCQRHDCVVSWGAKQASAGGKKARQVRKGKEARKGESVGGRRPCRGVTRPGRCVTYPGRGGMTRACASLYGWNGGLRAPRMANRGLAPLMGVEVCSAVLGRDRVSGGTGGRGCGQ